MNVGNLFRYGESPNGEDLKVNPSSTRNRSTNVIRKTALEDIRFEFIVNYILLKQRFKYTKQKSFMNILNQNEYQIFQYSYYKPGERIVTITA